MNNNIFKKSYLVTSLIVYFFVFISISFCITCSLSLFLWESPLTEEFIRLRAPRTFGNIFILSFLFTTILMILKYLIFDLPQHIKTNQSNVEEKIKIENLQNDFISNVSHEIKTPLAVIINYVSLLKNSDINESEREQYINNIEKQTNKISQLVSTILKINKLENGTYDISKTNVNVSNLLCESLLSFEKVLQEKEINLQTEFDENIFVKTDSQLLELVFNNLLSNAFKFTSSKGSIFVSCSEKENNIIVEISDTGCGISSEVGDKIFNKFYQADTSHKSEGNGLGLALVKQIIDLLCGEISVRSQVGVGTTFLITLTK